MHPKGYSPYQQNTRTKKRKTSRFGGRAKRWLWRILGALAFLFLIFYLSLGDLRFVANHYLGLTFFRQHYLVVFQNNYELRPGGGFVTAYGEVTTTLGFPTGIEFGNSYEIDTEDYVEPPFPHEKMLKNEWYEGYTFRDANWEPDFPKNAEVLIDFYQQKFPEKQVDGIIVMNFSVVEDLVNALGGIEIEGEKVDGSSLFSVITQEVNNVDRHDEEALLERKDILGPLSGALIKKAKWHPFKVKQVLVDALEEKELYVWLDSDRLQRKLEKRGWANRLNPNEDEDFVALNVANLGSKKADRYLQKEMYHFVDLTGPIPLVRTELTFRLPGGGNQYLDNYKGYIRLYLPVGAELKENLTEAEVLAEEGFTIIGQEITFPVGEERRLVYEYSLPRSLWGEEEYHLNLIKQSGSELMTSVVVEVPSHKQLESSTFEARENRAMWSGMLEKDQSFSLTLKPDTLPPFPTEQKFTDLNTLLIDWNEPLQETVARDATNYTLTDRNTTNTEVTDEIRVVYAELTGNLVTLELEGATDQPLERYTLRLNNLRDLSGNTTDPEVLEVTVVQRVGEESEED